MRNRKKLRQAVCACRGFLDITESTKSITHATPGGKYGGGSGSKGKGSAASYYGSGGGGGTYYVRSSSSETAAAGGSGYQGIVYLRIEKTQSEE